MPVAKPIEIASRSILRRNAGGRAGLGTATPYLPTPPESSIHLELKSPKVTPLTKELTWNWNFAAA